METKKYKILQNEISVCSHSYLSALILKSIKKRTTLLICPVATYALVKAYFNPQLRHLLDQFYLVPDSQWVKRSISFLYGEKDAIKMRATDLMLSAMSLAQSKNLRVFLYGTDNSTLKKLQNKLKDLFPKLYIAGAAPSLYRDLKTGEKKKLIQKVQNSSTDIMFVGIGSPLQEEFTYDLFYRQPSFHKSIVVITVGAAFDFISGVKPQAPRFMQILGLEWFFRLSDEPARLWKRYLIYGPLYVVLILLQKIKNIGMTR